MQSGGLLVEQHLQRIERRVDPGLRSQCGGASATAVRLSAAHFVSSGFCEEEHLPEVET